MRQFSSSATAGIVAYPEIIELIGDLPQFTSSRNVIYISNIVEVLTDRALHPENLSRIDGLHVFDGNLFVQTTAVFDYLLDVYDQLPIYAVEDVNMPEGTRQMTKPTTESILKMWEFQSRLRDE